MLCCAQGLQLPGSRPVTWEAGFAGSRRAAGSPGGLGWAELVTLTPQDAFGLSLSFSEAPPCPWEEEPLLGCPTPFPAGPSASPHLPKGAGCSQSHCLSCDGVFWPVPPRHALLTPFSGASMPLLRSHCARSGEVKGQAAGGRRPQPPGTQHGTWAQVTRPLTVTPLDRRHKSWAWPHGVWAGASCPHSPHRPT